MEVEIQVAQKYHKHFVQRRGQVRMFQFLN